MIPGDSNIRRRRYRRPGSWRSKADPRVLIPLAVPVALGLALAIVLALSGGPAGSKINPSADYSGLYQSGSPAANAIPPVPPDCSVRVPLHPLTAAGLSAPWLLAGPGGSDPNASGCTQTNPNLEAFVQATIINPANGQLSVYEPLVVTAGTTPAAAPVVPKLPQGAVVDIMIGFNGNNLQLIGAAPDTLLNNHCVNGLGGSLFGQVSYCNSGQFFAAANAAIASGLLHVPSNGISPVTGQQCPTTRSFDIVDQDQSDNVTTQYLLNGNGQTAQDNAANQAALPGTQVINNGSDNALLDFFVLPALHCSPFTAPDLSNGGAPGTSQTLDELSAMHNQHTPLALVPENDPMVLVHQQFSTEKTNLYRIGVGQPLVAAGAAQAFKFDDLSGNGQQADTPGNYCANLLNIQTPFIANTMAVFQNVDSPVPAAATSLFTFLAARLSASFMNLNCANFGLLNTVKTITNGGVVVAAQFNLFQQQPTSGFGGAPVSAVPASGSPGAPPSPTASPLPSPVSSPSSSPAPVPVQPGWPWGQYTDNPDTSQPVPWWGQP